MEGGKLRLFVSDSTLKYHLIPIKGHEDAYAFFDPSRFAIVLYSNFWESKGIHRVLMSYL